MDQESAHEACVRGIASGLDACTGGATACLVGSATLLVKCCGEKVDLQELDLPNAWQEKGRELQEDMGGMEQMDRCFLGTLCRSFLD